MEPSGWIQVLISSGVGAVVIAVINATVQRRKLGADATKVITDAAAAVTSDSRKDNALLRTEATEARARERALEKRVDELEDKEIAWQRERREWRQILQVHVAWDFEAIAALRSANPPIILRDPPPLTPEKEPG